MFMHREECVDAGVEVSSLRILCGFTPEDIRCRRKLNHVNGYPQYDALFIYKDNPIFCRLYSERLLI
jgi:hypothetical protein